MKKRNSKLQLHKETILDLADLKKVSGAGATDVCTQGQFCTTEPPFNQNTGACEPAFTD